ncbi:MAG TPA: PAS domain-containing protein [Rhizomicrobium sp.]|jgi:hypothetical protein
MARQHFQIDPETTEPPQLLAVRDYWGRKRGTRQMPSRNDIVPADLKAYLPVLMLMDVIGGGADFRYRLVGSRLQGYFPENPTGRLMSEAVGPFGAATLQQTLGVYRSVIARKGPLRIRGSGRYYGQEQKLFDALLAPLAEEGAAPNMILGSFLFAWDTSQEFSPPQDSNEAALEAALRR